jgi:DNA-directed RNA polymerase specialized sigma24 family protein
MTEEPDGAVIAASLREPGAFGVIFDRHGSTLLRFLARRVNPAEAEDLLGEVFRIAFERRPAFDRSRDSARPWLYGIAANLVAKHYRSETRRLRALARASSVLERSSNVLSLGHYRVLSAIASGEERASHVAARLALGRPAVSAAVESLCERGLLARFEVDGDHRAVTLLARVVVVMRGRLRDRAGRTPDGDQLLESLAWLGQAIDEWRSERWARKTTGQQP